MSHEIEQGDSLQYQGFRLNISIQQGLNRLQDAYNG